MTDKLFRRVRNKLQARLDARQREHERWPAVQGLSNDVGNADVPGMAGWVYVRIGNNESVARAFNNKTSHRNGLTVWVGKLPEQPTLFQVLDERQPYFNESAGGGSTRPHAAQHVWPGEDVVYARYRQLADCRVYATDPASLSVGVADGYYFIEDVIYYYAGATVDLSGYVPAAGRVWILLEMKSTGLNISSHATSSFDLDTIPTATDKSYWRIAAVALRPAQTEITDYPDDQHIFDLRQSRIAGSEYSDHGQLPGLADDDHTQYLLNWQNALIVHKSPGATRTGQYYNTLSDAVSAASSGDTILILPGTHDVSGLGVTKILHFVGLDRESCILEGDINCTQACTFQDLTIQEPAGSNPSTLAALYLSNSAGASEIYNCFVYCGNYGGGDGIGIRNTCTSGEVTVKRSHIEGYSSVANGYGISQEGASGAVRYEYCVVAGSTNDVKQTAGTLTHVFSILDDDSITGTLTYADRADGVTRTVGTGKDHATIQAAIDWFATKLAIVGANYIDVDAGSYDEAVSFSDLMLSAGATLTLRGDTRVLAGLSYVDGAAANQAGLTNGGDGAVTLSNAGAVVTVACATTNPDFDADGWGSGDTVLIYDNTGTITEYTIDSVLNNAITLTVAAPAVGNDATAICLLPDRRIERTSAGPCVQVETVRGIGVDGFYLESSTGAQCDGIYVLNGGVVEAVRVAIYAEDYGLNVLDLSMVIADGGAVSLWGASATARGAQTSRSAQAKLQYGIVNACQYGYRAYDFAFVSCPDSIAVNCSALAYSASNFSSVNAARGTARQNGTGYYASARGYVYAPTTNANNNGNGTDYNPAVSDAFGNNNGSITWS